MKTMPVREGKETQPWLLRTIGIACVIMLGLLIAGIVVLGYFGRTWTEAISFKVDDSWCKTGIEGLGRHCFGDFGLAYYRGYQPSAYLPNNYAAANTPMTALLFEILRLIPYNFALFAYLGGAVVALSYPIYAETRGLPTELRGLLILAISIVGAGSISALDRGNHVAFLVPLLYAYMTSIEERRWRKATYLLVCLAVLKFWGIIFVVALLLNRRFLESLKAVILTIAVSAVALVLFPGEFLSKIHAMTSMVTSKDYSNSIAGYSVSFFGLARRTGCLLSTDSWCNTKTYVGTFWTSTTALVVITFASLLVIAALHFTDTKHRFISTLLISLFGVTLVPDAPRYNTVFAIVMVALVLRRIQSQTSGQDSWGIQDVLPWVLGLSVAALIFPLTLGTNSLTRFSTGTGDSPLIARLDFWLVPLILIIVYAVAAFSVLQGWLRGYNQYRETKRHHHASRNR